MVSRVSVRPKTSFLLISLFIILLGSFDCPAQTEETEPVPLENFYVGVSRTARRRYQIKDLRVGDVSVLRLFKKIPREALRWYPGGYLHPEEVLLVINGGKELGELRQILIAILNARWRWFYRTGGILSGAGYRDGILKTHMSIAFVSG